MRVTVSDTDRELSLVVIAFTPARYRPSRPVG
jgi:hypothetical protein